MHKEIVSTWKPMTAWERKQLIQPSTSAGRREKSQSSVPMTSIAFDSPFISMTGKDGRVPTHRLVMAQQLDRPLRGHEFVRFRDGDVRNSNISNLELLNGSHLKAYRLKQKVVRLRKEADDCERLAERLDPHPELRE